MSQPIFSDRSQSIHRYNCSGNTLNISSLSDFYRPVDSVGFAIKFVSEGWERYIIEGQPYEVSDDSYLLLSGNKQAKVEIESKTNVKGICIDIVPTLIAEVVATVCRPDTAYADPQLASFFYTDQFLENRYSAAHNRLGQQLQCISHAIRNSSFSNADINTELFFSLAANLVADQSSVFQQLQSITTVKRATQRDLCRRLMRGREFIDAYFADDITVEQIAQSAAMSEFHFFRLFKRMYGLTPYQYMLRKRLQLACVLLLAQYSVSEVAFDCGFTDVFAFSKIFKKHYGLPPSVFAKAK